MTLARGILLLFISMVLLACGESDNGNQVIDNIKNSEVKQAGRDVIAGDQIQNIQQQQNIQLDTQVLIEQLRQRPQEMTPFEWHVTILGWVGLGIIIFFVGLGIIYTQLILPNVARQHVIQALQGEGYRRRLYQSGVSALLHWIERLYGAADSARAFRVSLLLAYFYPILWFVLAYSYFGGDYQFAGLRVFPEQSVWRGVYFPIFCGLTFVLTIAMCCDDIADRWMAKGLSHLSHCLSLKPFVVSIIYFLVSVFVFIFCAAPVSAPILALALALAPAPALASVLDSVFVPVFALASILALVLALVLAPVLAPVPVLASILAPVFVFVFVFVFIFGSDFELVNYNNRVFLLFFYAILPVLNAVFDWLSWWVSRYFLSKTLRTNNPWYIAFELIIDTVMAALFLLLLCLFLPAGALGLDWLAVKLDWIIGMSFSQAEREDFLLAVESDRITAFVVNAGSVSQTQWQYYAYAAYQAPWGEGLMVTMMLLTTFIPTLLHLIFGTTATVIHLLYGKQLAQFLVATPSGHRWHYLVASTWLLGYGVLATGLLFAIAWLVQGLLHLPIATWLYEFTYWFYSDFGMQAL